MPVNFAIDHVKKIAPGIWLAELAPADVRALGRAASIGEGRSVVGLHRASLAGDGRSLVFGPTEVSVLVAGSRNEAVLISLESTEASGSTSDSTSQRTQQRSSFARGDAAFIAACKSLLSREVAEIGETVLREVRRHHDGELVEAQARKWVNRPANFFTVTPQNRNNAYRVSIKGAPHSHSASVLSLVDGMAGYAEFVLRDKTEVREAISLILEAAKR